MTAPAIAGLCLTILLLLHMDNVQAKRKTGYRLPQTMGRSAGSGDSVADVGTSRDLFKKFMLWRGLFPQEPPRDNVIVIAPPSPVFTSFLTPTTTTTTTTTTNSTRSNGRWRSLQDQAGPTVLDNGSRQRLTQRRRSNPNSRGTRTNGQPRKQRKKTRHRHIKKRQRQQRQHLSAFAAEQLAEAEAEELHADSIGSYQNAKPRANEQTPKYSQMQSFLRTLQQSY